MIHLLVFAVLQAACAPVVCQSCLPLPKATPCLSEKDPCSDKALLQKVRGGKVKRGELVHQSMLKEVHALL